MSSFAAEVPSTIGVVEAYWRFPKERASFGVELPIPVTEMAGFSEIRGVRLVQVDPETDEELYSLVLDEFDGERSVSVVTELEVENGPGLLGTAWSRALAVARLAVEPPFPGVLP